MRRSIATVCLVVALQLTCATAASPAAFDDSHHNATTTTTTTSFQSHTISQRQLQTNPAFTAQNGLLVMEAESVPVVAPWVRETRVAGHTGSAYLRFNGNQDNGGPASGRTRFYFTIDKPGDYRLLLRTRKTNDARPDFANDCYTKLVGHSGYQGGDTKTYLRGASANHVWHTDTRFDLDHTPTTPVYTLTNVDKTYEFQLSGRSRNFHVDRVVLYHTRSVTHAFAANTGRPESPRAGKVVSYAQANFTKFTLMTAGTANDTPLRTIQDGDVVDVTDLGTASLSMIAEVTGEPNTVKFYYGDNIVWRETGAPYSMGGDSGGVSMKPVEYLSYPGVKKVLANAFVNGILQDEYEVTFTLVNTAPTDRPTVAPTIAPTIAPVTASPTATPVAPSTVTTTARPTLGQATEATSLIDTTKPPTVAVLPETSLPLELGTEVDADAENAAVLESSSMAPRVVWYGILMAAVYLL